MSQLPLGEFYRSALGALSDVLKCAKSSRRGQGFKHGALLRATLKSGLGSSLKR